MTAPVLESDASKDPAPGAAPGRDSVLSKFHLTNWDGAAAVLCVLLLVAFAPPLIFEAWTPRMAFILGAAPFGLVVLGVLAVRRDRAAVVLVAVLVWTVATSIIGEGARSALVGSAGRDLSAMCVCAVAGVWALGRQVSPTGRVMLARAFVGAGSCNALIGSLQVIGDVDTGPLAMLGGRPTGFLVNPVYFGAVCGAALSVAVASCESASWRRWSVPILLLGVGTSLSGSRVALLAALAVMVALLAVRHSRTIVHAVGLGATSLVLGVVLDRSFGHGRNAADRLSEGSGGGRLTVWEYAWDAWLGRPLLGYGFGRFRPAVQSRFSISFVHDHAADEARQAWFDAHNVGVGVLVAIGVIGAVLMAFWVVTWAMQIRGPLVWGLLAVALHWLLQPVSLAVLPVAALLFGAAGAAGAAGVADPAISPTATRARVGVDPARFNPPVVVACTVLGLLLAGWVLVADVSLQRAVDRSDGRQAAAAARMYFGDPVVSDIVAQVYGIESDTTRPNDDVLRWRLRAVDAEPDRPYWWVALARVQINRGELDDAERSVERALELQPTNMRALRAQAVIAIERDDESGLVTSFDLLCQLGGPECDIDPLPLLEPPDP